MCGTENQIQDGTLPEPKGPPDFDTRPGEPLRGTIILWIQRCVQCGYCAEDMTHATPEAEAILATPEYQSFLHAEMPAGARAFLAYSCLLSMHHQHADAGWSSLHAAWICDDVGLRAEASECRTRTIALWKQGKQAGQTFGDDLASEFALITDLHRRIGEFEHATVACADALDIEDIQPVLEVILRRQMTLIQSRDMAAHNLRELIPRP